MSVNLTGTARIRSTHDGQRSPGLASATSHNKMVQPHKTKATHAGTAHLRGSDGVTDEGFMKAMLPDPLDHGARLCRNAAQATGQALGIGSKLEGHVHENEILFNEPGQ